LKFAVINPEKRQIEIGNVSGGKGVRWKKRSLTGKKGGATQKKCL